MEGFPGEKKSKPRKVREAIKQDDLASLREMGKRGAEKSHEVQREKKANTEAANEYYAEKTRLKSEEEAQKQLEATNEHILPINPDEQEAA